MTRITFGVIFILVSAAVFFSAILPTWQKVSNLRAEIAGLVRLNDELQEIASARDELTAQYNAITQADLNKLSAMIPSGLGSAQLIRDMEALASRHGIFLRNIEFVSQEKQPTTQIQLLARRQVIPVDLSFKMFGSYEALRSFVRDLEKMTRVVDINDVSFGTRQQADAGKGLLEFSLAGTTYYSK